MIFIVGIAYSKSNLNERDDLMYPQDEIRSFLEYNPRNDTYLILKPDGSGYFEVDGQPEVFRRWGQSYIFVGYHGTCILRFESHPIPCPIRITSYNTCPQLGGIGIERLVASAWLDEFTDRAVIRHRSNQSSHPNAAYNMSVDSYSFRPLKSYMPEDYDKL